MYVENLGQQGTVISNVSKDEQVLVQIGKLKNECANSKFNNFKKSKTKKQNSVSQNYTKMNKTKMLKQKLM